MTAAHGPSIQEFVPANQRPSVAKRREGFGEPTLPETDQLAGQTLDIVFENGGTIRHEFTADQLTWTILGADGPGNTGTHPFRAVEARPSVVFVDFTKNEGTETHDVSIVINVDDGKVTVAESVLETADDQTRTKTNIISGRVAGTGDVEARERTSGLVGRRLNLRFSETENYEHVLFNAGTVAWHCLQGGEQGLAGVEAAKVF